MKYLGIDYGLKKIGLAVSEGEIASPYGVLSANSKAEALSKLQDVIAKENIDEVIFGLPESGAAKKAILKVIAELQFKVSAQVRTADETLSSHNAKTAMINFGVSKKKRMQEDAYAAVEILQNYLDNVKNK